eukprot:8523816-Ditylum_brightwellii.AAC.1
MIAMAIAIAGGECCDQQGRCGRNHVWGTAEIGRECCGSICKLFEGAHDALTLGMTNAPHPLLW